MNNLFLNPTGLSANIPISGEREYGYFLSKPLNEDHPKLVFDLDENASLNLTIVDFAACDSNLLLVVNLKKNASVKINVASINSLSYDKIYHADVNHMESDTTSLTHMAGINASQGKLEFWGNSLIVNGAHRSDTRQEGKITNLSRAAKSKVSPALLIKENDVKASHGAAVGAYNEKELFYLMSRGLTMEESKKLITYGSLLPVIETLGDEKLIQEAKEALGALTL